MTSNPRGCKAERPEPNRQDWSELTDDQICDAMNSSVEHDELHDPTLRYAIWRWDLKDQLGLAFVLIVFWLLTHDWWWQLARE